MKRNVFLLTILFVAGVLTCGMGISIRTGGDALLPMARAQEGGRTAPAIEGTWFLTVTPPQGSGVPPFQAFATFARGGAFLGIDPGTPPQYGTWTKTGGHEYATTTLAFGIRPDTNMPGTFKIQSEFRLVAGNQLEGKGILSFCDPAGANCNRLPGCSTITGTRLNVELPSCPQ